jgi:hypothetical protein
MKPLSCKQIDQQGLIEQYVAGRLSIPLREALEQHVAHCEKHAQALLIEKNIKRGVQAYARDELKKRIHVRARKRDDTKILILRFAAIFLVVIFTPLLLVYLFTEQKQSELVQNMVADSFQTHSTQVEKNIPEEKENFALSVSLEQAGTKSTPEKSTKKDTAKTRDIIIDESIAFQDSGNRVGYASTSAPALMSKKEEVPSVSAVMDNIAAGRSVFIPDDTCGQNRQFEIILKKHEQQMQAYFHTLHAQAAISIDFKFVVSPAGSVNSVQIVNTSKPLPVLEDSLTKSLLQLKFPQTGKSCQMHKKYILEQ